MLNRLFGIDDADTLLGRELLKVRYRALQRQIPIIYLIALSSLVGIQASSGSGFPAAWHPANFVGVAIVVRLFHWLRTSRATPDPEAIQRELRRTFLLAGSLSLITGYWAVDFLLAGSREQQDLIILFAALTAMGCSYGITSYPAAARLPLLLLALPVAIVLVFTPSTAHVAVGICLVLIIFLTLRLQGRANVGTVELVRSRTLVEGQRQRAEAAEQAALAEKARVKEIADTDPLTGLPNRRAFLAALEAALVAKEKFALALIDLDGFKPINDVFGHAVGDSALIEVAERLGHEGEGGVFVARIGGDEFAMLLPGGTGARALRAGDRLCRELGRSYRIGGREFRMSACCGIVVSGRERDVVTMLRHADAALYAAKSEGRGQTALFTPRLEQVNQRRAAIEKALGDVSVVGEIELVFQPIFDLASGAICEFEALARWRHPELGEIAPGEFIAIAEQANAIERISNALLAKAAATARGWPEDIGLAFNVSTVQLCSDGAAGEILAIIASSGLDPHRLRLEVTETSLMVDVDGALRNLERLRAAGVRIVLDDFGAGYASISYLRDLKFDAIKIDGALVTDATSGEGALRLLRGVIDLCASIGVPCIAEHIEEADHLALLRRLGCRYGQGYALSRPLSADVAAELAAARILPFSRAGGKRASHAA